MSTDRQNSEARPSHKRKGTKLAEDDRGSLSCRSAFTEKRLLGVKHISIALLYLGYNDAQAHPTRCLRSLDRTRCIQRSCRRGRSICAIHQPLLHLHNSRQACRWKLMSTLVRSKMPPFPWALRLLPSRPKNIHRPSPAAKRTMPVSSKKTDFTPASAYFDLRASRGVVHLGTRRCRGARCTVV